MILACRPPARPAPRRRRRGNRRVRIRSFDGTFGDGRRRHQRSNELPTFAERTTFTTPPALWLASEGAVVSSLLFPNSQWIDASGSFIWFHCSQLPTRPNHECSFATAQQTTAAFDPVEGHIGITGKRTILDDFQSPRSCQGKWPGLLVSIFMSPSQRFFDNSCIHRSDNVRYCFAFSCFSSS